MLDPVATAVKLVFCPSQIVLLVGCVVISGAVNTVIEWLFELLPQLFVVVSVNVYTPGSTLTGKVKFKVV